MANSNSQVVTPSTDDDVVAIARERAEAWVNYGYDSNAFDALGKVVLFGGEELCNINDFRYHVNRDGRPTRSDEEFEAVMVRALGEDYATDPMVARSGFIRAFTKEVVRLHAEAKLDDLELS